MGFQKCYRFAVLFLGLGILVGLMTAAPVSATKLGNIDVSGYVDLYTAWNLNRPALLAIPLHVFEGGDSSIAALQRLEVVLDHSAFRADIGYGPVDGVVAGPIGSTINLQQAFVKWPVSWMGRTISVDVGKFVTHMGFEVIESKDNWMYSRGLLFQFAIPYYHTGIRASAPINDNWWAFGSVLNGWNNIASTNRSVTLGVQVGGKPMSSLTTILNYITGPDAAGAAPGTAFAAAGAGGSSASVIDLVAMYDVNPSLSLGLNVDSGSAALSGGTASTYSAFALYAKYAMAAGTVVGRYESFNDGRGAFIGTPALATAAGTAVTISSLTIGYDVPLQKNTTGRVEYRMDSATPGTPFATSGAASGSQNVVTAGLVTTF